MIIAVDFDDTICINGKANTGLISRLQMEKRKGAIIILWTSRQGKRLKDAVAFCGRHGLFLDAVNENVPDTIRILGYNPRKVVADIYIDDKNVPLIIDY
jgi:hypothetical protein